MPPLRLPVAVLFYVTSILLPRQPEDVGALVLLVLGSMPVFGNKSKEAGGERKYAIHTLVTVNPRRISFVSEGEDEW